MIRMIFFNEMFFLFLKKLKKETQNERNEPEVSGMCSRDIPHFPIWDHDIFWNLER